MSAYACIALFPSPINHAPPLPPQTITTKDYHRPPNSMMLAWGVQRSKMKPQLDWSKSTTKTSYRMLAVLMKARLTRTI